MKYIIILIILSLLIGISSANDKCISCHPEVAANFSTSLHATGAGMFNEYEKGAMKHFNLNTTDYYEQKNCQKCHIVTCTQCHLGGSNHKESVSMDKCEPCHKKKQTSTYIGDMPMHKSKAPNADVHYEKGLVCQDCHTSKEIHGDGINYENQMQAVNVKCEDCHESHEKIHETLDCTACHTGWQLTCNKCHLETRKGTKPTFGEFYLAKTNNGMIQPFMKMDAEYKNKTHTMYCEYYSHTTTKDAKDCDFCHNDSSIYVTGDDIEFAGNGGIAFTQNEIDTILNIETEQKLSFIDRIQLWLDLK